MNSTSEFADCVVELAGVGLVVARRMSGGYGRYCDGVTFALIADDVLHLNADEASRPDLRAGRVQPGAVRSEKNARGPPARLLRPRRERESCAFATHRRLSPRRRMSPTTGRTRAPAELRSVVPRARGVPRRDELRSPRDAPRGPARRTELAGPRAAHAQEVGRHKRRGKRHSDHPGEPEPARPHRRAHPDPGDAERVAPPRPTPHSATPKINIGTSACCTAGC